MPFGNDKKLSFQNAQNTESKEDIENKSKLQFQDIPHEEMKEKKGKKKVQTHTFTSFPPTALSDDEEDYEDKAELLGNEKKAPSFWTFEYYQQFFDVDTKQVLWRILGSFIPHPSKNYLQKYIRPNPDLYGPFWICTTLVFTTAIAGNMANYLQAGGQNYQWRYDFHKVTFAATAIFSYWWVIPTCLFGLLWFRKSDAGYTFLEIISVYGYSLAIYIPISILWVIQVNWIQWILVIVGACLSGSVLLLTFWPALREDNKRLAMVTMILIFIFHALLAVGFVLYFFHVPPNSSAPAVSNRTTVVPVAKHEIPSAQHLKSKLNEAMKPNLTPEGIDKTDKSKVKSDPRTSNPDNPKKSSSILDKSLKSPKGNPIDNERDSVKKSLNEIDSTSNKKTETLIDKRKTLENPNNVMKS